MQIRDLFITANANLLRNKVRTFLTILAIFIGTFTLTITVGLNIGINQYIASQLNALGGDNLLTIMPEALEMSSGPQKYEEADESKTTNARGITMLDDEDTAKIEAIEGVESVTPISNPNITYAFSDEGEDKYKMTVSAEINGLGRDILAGDDFNAAQSNEASEEDVIELSLDMLEPFNFAQNVKDDPTEKAKSAIGKTLTLVASNRVTREQKEFKATINAVLNNSIINGSTSAINGAFAKRIQAFVDEGLPESVTSGHAALFVTVNPQYTSDQINHVRDQIIEAGYNAQTLTDQIGTVKSVIDGITYVLIAFALIALLAAGFGIVNTLLMSVSERTREIGLMKAMGMPSQKVFAIFSLEAVLIGFWGSLIAVVAGFGVSMKINQVLSGGILRDLTGLTIIQFTPLSTLLVVLGIMAIAFLAGTLPAVKASNQNPIDALRYE